MKSRDVSGTSTPSVIAQEAATTAQVSSAQAASNVSVESRFCQNLNVQQYSMTKNFLSNRRPLSTADYQKRRILMQDMRAPRLESIDESSEGFTHVVPELQMFSPSIRATFTKRWNFPPCNFTVRVGPTTAFNTAQKQKRPPMQCRKAGVGLALTLVMPTHCRRKMEIALYLIRISVQSRISVTLHWAAGFPRIIPRSAEIMHCVERGSIEEAQHLIAAGKATARDVTIHGITLLHLATSNLKMMRLLVQEGGDVNAQDEDGDTPLHWALARDNRFEIARLLMENGADIANYAVGRCTPLHTYFTDTIGEILLQDHWIEDTHPDSRGMSIAHFVAWSSKSTSDMFERSVSHTLTGLWSVDDLGRTCLHLAASRGNIDILEYLLERCSSFELRRKDKQGRAALHYAMQSKRLRAIDMLLAAGGDLYAKDKSSRTVLHHAARWQNLKAVQRIIALGDCKVLLSPDKDGHTPSSLAQGRDATALRGLLISLERAAGVEARPPENGRLSRIFNLGRIPVLSRKSPASALYWTCILVLAVLLSFSKSGFVSTSAANTHADVSNNARNLRSERPWAYRTASGKA